MQQKLKQRLQEFTRQPVGRRFQARYQRHHPSRRTSLGRLVSLVIGLVLLMGGLLMLITPGPGILILLLGGILLAEESLVVARIMDWGDLRIRALIRLVTNRQKQH